MVVMLTDVVEGGKVRCCRYWPEVKSSQEYGKYEITNLNEQSDRVFCTRQLRLRNRMVSLTKLMALNKMSIGQFLMLFLKTVLLLGKGTATVCAWKPLLWDCHIVVLCESGPRHLTMGMAKSLSSI